MSGSQRSAERFCGRVNDYVRYRPGYPDDVVGLVAREWDLPASPLAADIGSGTGISAEVFLRHGWRVIGVEPNAEMRAAADARLPSDSFTSIDGSAENTTLVQASVDVVIAAQAFHWFDVPAARREFIRILKPPGRVVLLWNTLRTNSPLLHDYEELLQCYGIDYSQVNHKIVGDEILNTFFAPSWKRFTLDSVQRFDLEGLLGRLRSSSFVPAEGHPNFAPMVARATQLFHKHQFGGHVDFEYDAEVYLGLIANA